MRKPILFLVMILFIVGCKEVTKEKVSKEISEKMPKTLSELQAASCNAAEEAGTCQTRLIDVAVVMPDECCEALGKCCKNE